MINLIKKHSRVLIIAFFCFYFMVGVLVVSDYGISGDEHTERETSIRQYRFAVSKIYNTITHQQVPGFEHDHLWYQNWLQGNHDKYYGTFLQSPIVIWEHLNDFSLPLNQVYYLRHILNFIYFFIGLVCFYLLLQNRFHKRWLALLGVLFIILTPRFFAESFYNNKDILFASTYIAAIYFCTKLSSRFTWANVFFTAVAVAIAANTRIVALIIPVVFLLGLIKDNYQGIRNKLKIIILPCLIYLIYILIHPASWGHETTFIFEVLKTFSTFPWQWGTLYRGEIVKVDNQPWHFALGYMWATIPLVFSFLISGGLAAFIWVIIKKTSSNTKKIFQLVSSQDCQMFALALFPLLGVIASQAVLYQGWRHIYFIYFPLVYFAVFLINYFWQVSQARIVLLSLVMISFVATLAWMIINHPQQYLYYNLLIKGDVEQDFERDYWGLSRQDLFELLMTTTADEQPIRIAKSDPMADYVWFRLSEQNIKQKFEFVDDINDADYFNIVFSNYRGSELVDDHYVNKAYDQDINLTQFEEIDRVVIDGITVAIQYQKITP